MNLLDNLDNLFSSLAAPANGGRHFPGPYGLQLYSLRHQLPGHVVAWLQRVRRIGYTEVETAGLDGLSLPAFQRALHASGLRCVGMHNSYARYQHDLAGAVREAHTLGAHYLVCPELPQAGRRLEMSDVRRAAADFNRWAAELRRHRLRFAFHAEVNAFTPIGHAGHPGFDHLVALTHPSVLLEMDVFWVKRGGQDPVAYLRRYPRRFRMLHLKDMRRGTPQGAPFNAPTSNEDCVPLGRGILDIPGILRESMRIGVKHYFVEDESREAPRGIVASLKYMKTVGL